MTSAHVLAYTCGTRIVTPEHLLLIALEEPAVLSALQGLAQLPVEDVMQRLREYTDRLDKLSDDEDDVDMMGSHQYGELIKGLEMMARTSSAKVLDVPHLLNVMLTLKDSFAANCLMALIGDNKGDFLQAITNAYEEGNDVGNMAQPAEPDEQPQQPQQPSAANGSWRDFVLCINDHLADHNPLIGREAELDRTIQVLCRKEKNNPLHIGEPGVGKTSIVYGLAQRIEDGNVPEVLKGSRIYQLDLGALIAGTQFRGDFEKRLKMVMKGIAAEPGTILYIDEIHNIVGAGQTGEGSMDASNLLKPYLESGKVRFIGATTYEEYNRYIMRNKGLMRRFQQVPIEEPSIEETLKIVQMLKESYEAFHHVKYDDDALQFAVEGSARHITDRYLPDKAIDLMDEAGAWVQMNRKEDESRVVDKALIANVLARVAKVDALTMDDSDNDRLESLEPRILDKIYGQDQAVKQVVEAVQMSKAGLTDENKPLASLLFVGPTGVGKTEVARVLAQELGVELVRFDMSEYVEKHTVAKLIGSPAGYVGYDDGGLLTDAVRKHPDCVLLLDEIEKAHDDIFNDAQTSEEDVQARVHQPPVVDCRVQRHGPHHGYHTMAGMILDKKLRELQEMLTAKGVTLKLGAKAREQLLHEGYSQEYGAREMDRIIHNHLKTKLVREILFGSLKQGGECVINDLDELKS